ncbi:hypothetical protein LO772_02095 [Yinghuangia sp. ASG 101]|uniref:hypothetical protein n=1 Tax=Yinghuangia sp. ASG 101 TaxID=2896848 RepID=UPI001E3B7B47|nr:hypothetical protein [Yinghuangia sp. ASG 101]UGQ12429.1 hypothetical protein LO772_02095 [Yinghuangia sp. ASG 101]
MRSSEDDLFAAFPSQSAVWALKRAGYPSIGRWPTPDAATPPSAQVWDFEVHAALLTDGPADTVRAPVEPPLATPPDRPATDRPGADRPGADEAGPDGPGADRPGSVWPGSVWPGTDDPGADTPPTGAWHAVPPDPEPPHAASRVPAPDAFGPDVPDPDAPTLEKPRVTVELPVQRTRPHSHRRQVPRTTSRGLVFLSRTMVVLSALVVALVVFLGALSTLAPMAYVAATTGHPGAARWWPFLIHGPWLVAALSLVRAGIHHRRAMHSWLVIAAFAALSMALSISYAPKNMQGIIVAVLPAAAMTACLHQLVRQITLTRPPARSTPEHPGDPRG